MTRKTLWLDRTYILINTVLNTQKLIGNRISAAVDNFLTALAWHTLYKIMKVIVAEILPCLLQTVTCSSLRLVRLFSCLSTPCIFVLRAGKITIYISAQTFFFPRVYNANIYKICELHRAIFSSFYNNSQRNVAMLLILRCSYQLW
jgi:hypothetical protein